MRLRVPLAQSPDWYRKVAIAVNLLLGDIPEGGTTAQVLAKASGDDWDLEWLSLTKSSVGLGNVDNTSDANKPVSTATQTALDGKLEWAAAPASASATGTAGQIAYDADYLYVCTATDTWRRVAHSTW